MRGVTTFAVAMRVSIGGVSYTADQPVIKAHHLDMRAFAQSAQMDCPTRESLELAEACA
jgi:hypothetical protein